MHLVVPWGLICLNTPLEFNRILLDYCYILVLYDWMGVPPLDDRLRSLCWGY